MKPEDEKYFSAKMHVLADKFNEVVNAFNNSTATDLNKIRDSFREYAGKLDTEFKAAGYAEADWNSLMERSGAGRRLGMGG